MGTYPIFHFSSFRAFPFHEKHALIPRVNHSASQPVSQSVSQSASLHHLVHFISSHHTLASVRPGNSQRATPWARSRIHIAATKKSPVVPVPITSSFSLVPPHYYSGNSQCKQQHFLGRRKTCMPNRRLQPKVATKSCRDFVPNYFLFYMHTWYILVCLFPTARADACYICTCFFAPLS